MSARRGGPDGGLILSAGRTGKTHLISMLNRHPRAFIHDEPMHSLIHQGSDAQFAWLDRELGNTSRDVDLVGVATKLRTMLDDARFRAWILDHPPKLVYMGRRNIVKTVVSVIRGRDLNHQSQTWHSRTEDERLAPYTIDPKQFHIDLTRRLGFDARLDAFVDSIRDYIPVHDLYYEDLLQAPVETTEQLTTFFGLEPLERLDSPLIKSTSDDLRESVTNIAQLAEQYRGTRFEAMFEVDPDPTER